jgi:hypothetical protein
VSDIHIDDFHKDCAKILVQLYRQFPRKTILYVEDYAGPDMPDEYGLHSERHQAGFSAAIWLAESGYIHYLETIRQEALDQVVLTHKGFTLLSARANFIAAEPESDNQLPTSIVENTQTNIHQLRQAIKQGSSTQVGQLMQQLLLQARHFS